MARLMWICGILLIAAGLALGIVLFVSPARPGGIDLQTAAILLVGGILALGLGSLIDGQARVAERPAERPVERPAPRPAAVPEPVVAAATAAATTAAAAATPIPEFDPRAAKAAAPPEPEASEEASEIVPEDEVSRPTRETIEALEQARQKIERAFDARSNPPAGAEPEAEPEGESTYVSDLEAQAEAEADGEAEIEAAAEDAVAEDVVIEEDAVAEDVVIDEGQLYVVEERMIRRHPARILSDGTVEAETAEGWMRFENLEHLNEYLDAMEPARG